MKCCICGKEKNMLAGTIYAKKGINHKNCGRGRGVTYDKVFYNRWQSMRARTSPKFWAHKQYYDRGINSDEFASFADFYDSMYDSWLVHKSLYGEANTSLERIDVDKSYTKNNCCWICLKQQKSNMQKQYILW